MARRACHEQKDDVLRFRREVWRPRRQRVVSRIARFCQEMSQGRRSQSHAALLEEPAARDLPGTHVSIEMILAIHDYSFVIVSSRLRMTRDIAVHAANCLGVAPAGRL